MLHRMRLTGLVALALCVALVASSIAIACPSGGGSAGSASASTVAAAKKKCKAGYHVVTVKRHGKRTKVCKKNPYTQQGP
jgi:hypothetical protein